MTALGLILTTVDVATTADLTAHTEDASDAHDASAVSVVPFATIAATNVQAAIEEIVAESGGGATSPLTGATVDGGAGGSVAFDDAPGGGDGGGVVLSSGDGAAGDAPAGNIEIIVGASTGSATGGDITITAGDGGPTGHGGDFEFSAGAGGTGEDGGELFMQAGDSEAGEKASIRLGGGTAGGDHGRVQISTDASAGLLGQVLMAQGDDTALWKTPTVRTGAGVPSGAPTGTELPFAYNTTAVTGGFYYWNGSAWVKVATIL